VSPLGAALVIACAMVAQGANCVQAIPLPAGEGLTYQVVAANDMLTAGFVAASIFAHRGTASREIASVLISPRGPLANPEAPKHKNKSAASKQTSITVLFELDLRNDSSRVVEDLFIGAFS